MRLFIWLCLIASLFAIGCSSNLPPKDTAAIKKEIQTNRALSSPQVPQLADNRRVAENICSDQGGVVNILDHNNADCLLENKIIFSYHCVLDKNDEGIIVGVDAYFHGDTGEIMHFAVLKYGPPTWKDDIAFWYNPKNDVVLSIQHKDKITILGVFISSAFNTSL